MDFVNRKNIVFKLHILKCMISKNIIKIIGTHTIVMICWQSALYLDFVVSKHADPIGLGLRQIFFSFMHIIATIGFYTFYYFKKQSLGFWQVVIYNFLGIFFAILLQIFIQKNIMVLLWNLRS